MADKFEKKNVFEKIFPGSRGKVLFLILIASFALVVRGLTAEFIYQHINDAAWFPYGTYAIFDQQAQNILDGKTGVFWIEDPAQTDKAIYPPGYSLWLSLIYFASGVRSIAVVQC